MTLTVSGNEGRQEVSYSQASNGRQLYQESPPIKANVVAVWISSLIARQLDGCGERLYTSGRMMIKWSVPACSGLFHTLCVPNNIV